MIHLRRVFLTNEFELIPGRLYPLSSSQIHYLTRVIRLQDQSEIIVVSKNHSALASLVITGSEQGALITSLLNEPNRQHHVATLIFSLCKGGNSELVIEKATELGVDHIIAYQADRSVVRVKSGSDAERKLTRFTKVAESAAAQSRQTTVPVISLALTASDLMGQFLPLVESSDLTLLCSLSESAVPINQVCRKGSRVHLLIGPEGDFTSQELSRFDSAGSIHVSLGANVLRAETAAIASMAMVLALSS
jgi:16S rRNA (uracil1498-N3)-methyltransferase